MYWKTTGLSSFNDSPYSTESKVSSKETLSLM